MKTYSILTIVLAAALALSCSVQAQRSEIEMKNELKMKAIDTAESAAQNALKVGALAPSFSLADANSKTVASSELFAQGNVVLVFYRGAWCPFCNTYLRKLQQNLGAIMENGGVLVAVSAENSDNSLDVTTKNKLDYTVLSDPNLDLARKFGLVYQLPDDTNKKYIEYGIDLAKRNSMEKAELPISATYVIGKDGKIAYAFLDPDYKKRAEPDKIIDTLKALKMTNK